MEYIFMDLDGTITDSREGITNCFEYALSHFGIEVADKAQLEQYIGPPLEESFREGFGMSHEQAVLAVQKYRERFIPTGMYENKVYDGIEDALRRLKEAGKVLVVATSKPEYMAVTILKHFGLEGYFDDICGADDEAGRNYKDEVLRYALEKHEITDMSDVLMVGDRKYDVIGAAMCGISCMGVLYGFGSRTELEEAGAAYLAETPEEMAKIIISL